jgi:hypothetical protein
VLVDVSSRRDCSGIGSGDVRPSEAIGAEPHRSFAAYQSRSRAAHIEDLSAAVEKNVWLLWRPARLNQDARHDAVLIHGTPKIVLHALNPNEHLIPE